MCRRMWVLARLKVQTDVSIGGYQLGSRCNGRGYGQLALRIGLGM